MERGCLDNIKNSPIYSKLNKKSWIIEVIYVDFIAYKDIIFSEEFKKGTATKYIDLKEKIKKDIDRRFIYFIVSRKKINITKIKLNKRFFTVWLDIPLYRKRSIKIKIDINKFNILCWKLLKYLKLENNRDINIAHNSERIFFIIDDENSISIDIYKFIEELKINLPMNESEVKYIGLTKNPDRRPLDGNHSGLNRILHDKKNDEEIFIYYNLFKVSVTAKSNDSPIIFTGSNAYLDEIDINREALIIEHALIDYFNPEYQGTDIDKSKHKIKSLYENFNIKEVFLTYDTTLNAGFNITGSKHTAYKDGHHFAYTFIDKKDSLELKTYETVKEYTNKTIP